MLFLCEIIRIMKMNNTFFMGFYNLLWKQDTHSQILADLTSHVITLGRVDHRILVRILLLYFFVQLVDQGQNPIIGSVGLAGQLSLIAVTHILLCYLVSTHLHNAGLDDILDILYMDRMSHACDLVSYILRYRLDLVRIHLMQLICLFIGSVDRIDDLMQVKVHFFPASLDHSFV